MKLTLTVIFLIFFLLLVFIESLFTAILYVDIERADRLAKQEFSYISICRDLYENLKGYNIVVDALSYEADAHSNGKLQGGGAAFRSSTGKPFGSCCSN